MAPWPTPARRPRARWCWRVPLHDEALAGVPGIAEVAAEPLSDGRLRLVAKLAPNAPVQAALRAIFARDLDITGLELKEPHLHDAFIALTGAGGMVPEAAAA